MKKLVAMVGFTLVELIVVVTIIMVISAMVAVSFSGTNNKARDSRRLSDIEKIRTAAELYRQQYGSYPPLGTDLVPEFLPVWPSDPKNYLYFYSVGGSYSYTLDGHLEDVGSTNGSWGNNCNAVCNYRVLNP